MSRCLVGEKVSRRHRCVSGVARLSVGEQVGVPFRGGGRARVWGGAVCEGRAWRGVDGFLTSLWSPGPAEGLNPGVGGLPAWEFEKL